MSCEPRPNSTASNIQPESKTLLACHAARVTRRSLPKRDQLLLCIGAAKKEAGRPFGFVAVLVPKAEQEVTRETVTSAVEKEKLRKAELRDGHYLLRSNLTAEDPGVLWEHSEESVAGTGSRTVGQGCPGDAGAHADAGFYVSSRGWTPVGFAVLHTTRTGREASAASTATYSGTTASQLCR